MTTSGIEFSVYKITNVVNGKFYIGITGKGIAHRWRRHVYNAKHKSKYGRLPAAILKYGKENFKVECLEVYPSPAEAKAAEVRIISELKPHYNATLGGDGTAGHTLNEEARSKARERMLGSKLNLGRRWTDEQKLQMSLKLRGRKAPQPTDLMQKTRADNCRKRARETRRKVICITTGMQYESVSSAATAHGLCKTTVSAICRKKRKAAYGIQFEFAVAA
jgi:group I intron endonuclease